MSSMKLSFTRLLGLHRTNTQFFNHSFQNHQNSTLFTPRKKDKKVAMKKVKMWHKFIFFSLLPRPLFRHKRKNIAKKMNFFRNRLFQMIILKKRYFFSFSFFSKITIKTHKLLSKCNCCMEIMS